MPKGPEMTIDALHESLEIFRAAGVRGYPFSAEHDVLYLHSVCMVLTDESLKRLGTVALRTPDDDELYHQVLLAAEVPALSKDQLVRLLELGWSWDWDHACWRIFV